MMLTKGTRLKLKTDTTHNKPLKAGSIWEVIEMDPIHTDVRSWRIELVSVFETEVLYLPERVLEEYFEVISGLAVKVPSVLKKWYAESGKYISKGDASN